METKTFTRGWIGARVQHIERTLKIRYGEGWRNCFSAEVQEALVNAEVLALIRMQALPEYAPAIELARAVADYRERDAKAAM